VVYRRKVVPLAITSGRLVRICFSSRIEFRLLQTSEGACLVALGTPFEIATTGLTRRVSPDHPGDAVELIVGLRDSELEVLTVDDGGTLTVRLRGGTVLMAHPHDRYEAWELHSDSKDLVSIPGGGVAIWERDET
jgi:hypothetical protein